jgi:hypothetical protein
MYFAVIGDSDRTEMREIQSQLQCGMSLEQIHVVAKISPRAVESSPGRPATHYLDRRLAYLRLNLRDGKLRWSELEFLDGPMSVKQEKRINHCET